MQYGNQQQFYQMQLNIRMQIPGETLQQFEKMFSGLFDCIYHSTIRLDRLAIQTFINGVRDIVIQQALQLVPPTKIEDVLEHKAAYQASKSNLFLRQM